jgi:serine/threonine protein kinase
MHERNIVHCDLKEGNILISFEKDNSTDLESACLPVAFKIADLGIAKDLSVEKPGEILMNSGTPKYMAPEQFVSRRGKIENPFLCDVYSLGVILFHLIFKEYPFSPNSFED